MVLLPLLISKRRADVVSPLYVGFFPGSLGFGPKEPWGKCHPATLQIKAKERSTSALLWDRRAFLSCCCQHWLLSLWVVIKGSQIISEPLVVIGGRARIG